MVHNKNLGEPDAAAAALTHSALWTLHSALCTPLHMIQVANVLKSRHVFYSSRLLCHNFSNEKDDNKSEVGKAPRWKALLKILMPERAHIAGAACALVATSGSTLAFPHLTGKLMDGFASSSQSPDMWLELVNSNAALCLGAVSIVGFGGFLRLYLLETASEKISRRLRLQLFTSLLSKPQTFYDSSTTGDLVSRIGADVTRVSRSLMDASFGCRVLINAVVGTAMVVTTVPATLVPVLLGPVTVMFAGGFAYGRFVKRVSARQTEAMAASTQIAEENLSLIRVVKLFHGERRSVNEYEKSLDKVYALARTSALASGGFVMVFTTIGGGFILHVIYNCGMLINSGMLTIGQTSALAGYLLLSGASYQGLISAYGEIQKALGACDRIVTLMEDTADASSPSLSPPTSPRAHPLVFSGSSISSAPSATLRDVRFRYSPCAPLVLDGFSMFVPSGAKQSIVGLSGSGKSSVLMLLGKMYEPLEGEIFLDNINLRAMDGAYLREKVVSFVPQETSLFNASIRCNVWYPNEPPEDHVAREALLVDQARLGFVSDWGAPVGERGQNLSGGERQRVAIARALAARKPLLLLDEATSALDRESDAAVLQHLSQQHGHQNGVGTVVAVTHRLSAIEWADRLTVVAGGKVVQEGDSRELLRAPGPVLRRLLTQISDDER